MLPKNHKNREEIIQLKKKIDDKIRLLKKAGKEIDTILNQQAIEKNTDTLKFTERVIEEANYIIGTLSDYQRYKEIERVWPPAAFTKERMYKRDLCLSVFHRSLDKSCYVTDLDFLETRKIDGVHVPVLLYDAKKALVLENIDRYKKEYRTPMSIYLMVAQKLGCPFWVVSYFPPQMDLVVYDIKAVIPEIVFERTEMTASIFKNTIENLGKP